MGGTSEVGSDVISVTAFSVGATTGVFVGEGIFVCVAGTGSLTDVAATGEGVGDAGTCTTGATLGAIPVGVA